MDLDALDRRQRRLGEDLTLEVTRLLSRQFDQPLLKTVDLVGKVEGIQGGFVVGQFRLLLGRQYPGLQ